MMAHDKSPLQPGGRGSELNALSTLFLGLTIVITLYYLAVILFPGAGFNPFRPRPTEVAQIVIATPTPTEQISTFTPTPEIIYTPTPTRAPLTPTPTRTQRPTRTPLPTETSTPSITPTPTEDMCKTLKLLGPPIGTKYFQYDIVTLAWTFGRPLAPGEHFDVLLDPPAAGMGSIGWADVTNPKNKNCGQYCQYDVGINGIYPGGRFIWTIGLIKEGKKPGDKTTQVCPSPAAFYFEH
jgi:hypothetical protein